MPLRQVGRMLLLAVGGHQKDVWGVRTDSQLHHCPLGLPGQLSSFQSSQALGSASASCPWGLGLTTAPQHCSLAVGLIASGQPSSPVPRSLCPLSWCYWHARDNLAPGVGALSADLRAGW